MSKSELWLLFAHLNPRRWKLYDGYCQCELCREYRELFSQWLAAYQPAEPGGGREMSELLPCPFCGSTDIRMCSNYAECRSCETEGPVDEGHDPAKVAELWNRRTPGPATAKMLEWVKVYFNPPEKGPFVDMCCAKSVLESFLAEWSAHEQAPASDRGGEDAR